MWNDTIESNRVQCGNPLSAAGGVIFLPSLHRRFRFAREPPRPLTPSPKVSPCSFLHLLQLSLLFIKENNQKIEEKRRDGRASRDSRCCIIKNVSKRARQTKISLVPRLSLSLHLYVYSLRERKQRPLVIRLSPSVSPLKVSLALPASARPLVMRLHLW